MIREATHNDLDIVVKLGLSFFNEAKTELTPKFSEEKAIAVICNMIDNGDCILYVAEHDGVIVGMIGAMISEHWFSEEIIAQELFWYVLPEHRGFGIELLDMLEIKAKELGVSKIAMVDLDGKSPISTILRRRGYSVHEKSYVKGI